MDTHFSVTIRNNDGCKFRRRLCQFRGNFEFIFVNLTGSITVVRLLRHFLVFFQIIIFRRLRSSVLLSVCDICAFRNVVCFAFFFNFFWYVSLFLIWLDLTEFIRRQTSKEPIWISMIFFAYVRKYTKPILDMFDN